MEKDRLNLSKMEIKKEVIEENFGENSALSCESTDVKEENVSEFLGLTQKLPKPTKIKIEGNEKRIYAKNFKCDECEKAFSRRSELNRHKNKHRNFECKTCGIKFQRKHCFDKHECSICEICNKIFKHKTNLTTHMETHHSENRRKFECDFCDKIFVNRHGIQRHIIESHSSFEKSFKCDICGKMFATLSLLKIHMRSHQKTSCNICDKLILTKSLRSHMHHRHGNNESFKCDKCPKVYKARSGLNSHLAIHNKAFSCKICNKIFSNKKNLADHLTLHENPEAFQCTVCGKGSSSFLLLKIHMKSMHGDKKDLKYQCEKCEFATQTKKLIENHRKAHEKYEEKLKSQSDWFKCEKCPAFLATKRNLRAHVLHVHECLTVQCDLCGRNLKFVKPKLKIHFIRIHKKCL